VTPYDTNDKQQKHNFRMIRDIKYMSQKSSIHYIFHLPYCLLFHRMHSKLNKGSSVTAYYFRHYYITFTTNGRFSCKFATTMW